MSVLSRLSALKPFKTATIIIRHFTQLKPYAVKNVPKYTRSFYSKLFKKETEKSFKLKDDMPQPYELIYRNTMENYLKMTQICSSLCLLMLGIVVLSGTNVEEKQLVIDFWSQNPKAVENEIYVYMTCLAAMSVILQMLLTKMPVRVYNWAQQEKYVFVYYRGVPFLTRRETCLQKEISKSAESGILPWRDHRYDIKSSSGIILLETFFRKPCDFCDDEPITGSYRHCTKCISNSVDYWTDCVLSQLYSNQPHSLNHKFIVVRDDKTILDPLDSESESELDESSVKNVESGDYSDSEYESSSAVSEIKCESEIVSFGPSDDDNYSFVVNESCPANIFEVKKEQFNGDFTKTQEVSYNYLHSNLLLDDS